LDGINLPPLKKEKYEVEIKKNEKDNFKEIKIVKIVVYLLRIKALYL
jgi:hypothetical protein